MPLFYNSQQRVNPIDREAPKKWYLSIKSTKQLKKESVAKDISDETTLNPMEAQMALYQLEKVLIRWLLEGRTVKLGDLGSFSLTVKSKAVDTEEEVHPRIVEKVNVRFRPSEALKEAINKAEFLPSDAVSNKK